MCRLRHGRHSLSVPVPMKCARLVIGTRSDRSPGSNLLQLSVEGQKVHDIGSKEREVDHAIAQDVDGREIPEERSARAERAVFDDGVAEVRAAPREIEHTFAALRHATLADESLRHGHIVAVGIEYHARSLENQVADFESRENNRHSRSGPAALLH